MNGIRSVLVDNSFCIRLLKPDDALHLQTVEYFKYFLQNEIEMYLSTVVVGEYAVGDDPDNLLALNAFRLLEFDYMDAKLSGEFYASLKDNPRLRDIEARSVIINDLKLFAQIKNRAIDAFISKDRASLNKMITPLKASHQFHFEFIDLAVPLNENLGTLF